MNQYLVLFFIILQGCALIAAKESLNEQKDPLEVSLAQASMESTPQQSITKEGTPTVKEIQVEAKPVSNDNVPNGIKEKMAELRRLKEARLANQERATPERTSVDPATDAPITKEKRLEIEKTTEVMPSGDTVEVVAPSGPVIDHYYRDVRPLDPQQSAELIATLPMTYYFDIFLGKFRLGVLGSLATGSAEEMVSNKDLKMIKKKKIFSLDAVPVMDVPSLLVHGLAATQHLSKQGDNYSTSMQELKTYDDFEGNVERTIEQAYNDMKIDGLAVDFQTKKDSTELNTRTMQVIRVREEKSRDAKIGRFDKRASGRIVLRTEQHESLMRHSAEHLRLMSEIKTDGMQRVADIRAKREEKKFQDEEVMLQFNYENDVTKMKRETEEVVLTSKFRLEEEMRYVKETEATMLRRLEAQSGAEAEELEKFIATATNEITSIMQFAAENKLAIMERLTIGLMLLLAVIVVFESATMARQFFFMVSKRSIPMRYRHQSKSKFEYFFSKFGKLFCRNVEEELRMRVALDDVVVDSAKRQAFRRTSQSICEAAKINSPLPHIIMRGTPGTGKSIAGNAIANDSGITACTINTSELLGLGEKSSLYLFDFLHRIKCGNTPTIVVMEKIDEIIKCREASVDAKGFTESCFYVLLQIMRDPSPMLGIVLTCSLDVADIDRALLDRTDALLEMTLPVAPLRLEYSIKRTVNLFGPYLTAAKLDEIVALANSKSNERQSITNESPETDIPRKKGSFNKLDNLLPSIGYSDLDKILCTGSKSSGNKQLDDFDAVRCMDILVKKSQQWSYRDIEKVFNAVISAVLGTVECRITTRIFVNEVRNILKDKENEVHI